MFRINNSYDMMYQENLEYFHELEYYIIARKESIEELRSETLPKLREEAAASDNPMDAQLLKTNTIETAKESNRGIVDVETLQKVNRDLIDTIEETMKIQQEGRAKRQAAEAELYRIEEELKNKLVEVRA